MPDQPRASVGTLGTGAKLDRYEILARLAAGGMATVYVARVQAVAAFERLFAIKVLHSNLAHEDEFIRMFLDEARLAASIRHPNVVATTDVSKSNEAGCGYFIVMEYIEGDHLGALLSNAHKAGERLPVPVALRIIVDALGGLGAAHALCDETGRSLQLVHRDVSPHNIMVGRDGVVRLTDFGVAKAEDRLTHTRDGQVKGKLAYMAPEQAGSAETDARSDLFSMGIILWECITGKRLFRADTTAGTLHRLLHEEIEKPSHVDPTLAPLDALLAKALSREPAERFQSAEEFARAIEEVAPQVGGVASLRGVSRAVKQYAAAKLKREKKLVEDAVRALRPSDVAPDAPEQLEEFSSPSATDISVTGASLSQSKVSGVFSHDTQPGTLWVGARRGDATGTAVTPPRGTMGAVGASGANNTSDDDRPTLRAPAREARALANSTPEPIVIESDPSALRGLPRRVQHVGLGLAGVVVAVGVYYTLTLLNTSRVTSVPTTTPAPSAAAVGAPSATTRALSPSSDPAGASHWKTHSVSTVPSPTAAGVNVNAPVIAAPLPSPAPARAEMERAERRLDGAGGGLRSPEARQERMARQNLRRDRDDASGPRVRRTRRDREREREQVQQPATVRHDKPDPRPEPEPVLESDVIPNPYHD
ncbi:MAG: serine/threonine-protein kinase [Polyangiales bacterium]